MELEHPGNDPYGRPADKVTLHVRGGDWEAESILDTRLRLDRREYLIKWKGRDPTSNTWEMETRMESDFHDLLEAYRSAHPEIRHTRSAFVPRIWNKTLAGNFYSSDRTWDFAEEVLEEGYYSDDARNRYKPRRLENNPIILRRAPSPF